MPLSLLVLPDLFNDLVNDNNNKKQWQKQRENESNNLLTVSKLILNSFLDTSIRGSKKLELDTPELLDLLIVLEKVIGHGLKVTASRSSLFPRKADERLWLAICHIAESHAPFLQTIQGVRALDHINTAIARIRAFLRISIMKKELADYLQVIHDSPLCGTYYEAWAFMNTDLGPMLAGSLLALRVFDCNLLLDNDILMDTPGNVDLARYVKIPLTISQFTNGTAPNDPEDKNEVKFREIIDQKHYVEEQNRQLATSLEEARSQLSKVKILEVQSSEEKAKELENTVAEKDMQIQELRKQRDDLAAHIRKHITKRGEESTALTRKLKEFEAFHQIIKKTESPIMNKIETMEDRITNCTRRLNEYLKKNRVKTNRTDTDFFTLVSNIEDKQLEIQELTKKNDALSNRVADLEKHISRADEAIKELATLRVQHAELAERLFDSEQALEDLGPQLSSSILQVSMMKEQLLPTSEWMKDSEIDNCMTCNAPFSITCRKHHCRRCGRIFCDACSKQRVNLPSHSKQVRVCGDCYLLLESLQNT